MLVPARTIPLSVPANGRTITGDVPDDLALYFFHLYLQALEADPFASHGISFTKGLERVYGFDCRESSPARVHGEGRDRGGVES